MIECTCINDSAKPNAIPHNKWVKKGSKYHIIFARIVLPQRTLGVELAEIAMDETCLPYEYFLGSRFHVNSKDLDALLQMIRETSEVQTSIQELQKQTGHVVETHN